MQKKISSSKYYEEANIADLFVDQLVKSGIEAIYINSGTDTVPIQEAIAKRDKFKVKNPKVILCLDELVAGSAAHGHYLLSKKPQAVIVHVDVGTLQLGGSLHNAQRGRASILFFAGRAPYTIDQGIDGERSSPIHWIQEQLDQHGIVRNYTKWDYELTRPENINLVIKRGIQVASSYPAGPIYISLPREILMEKNKLKIEKNNNHPIINPPPPTKKDIDLIVEKLLSAKKPMIITSFLGEEKKAVHELEKISEHLNIPIFSSGERLNFPTTHEFFMNSSASEVVNQADLILIIESVVPYIPSTNQPKKSAFIIQIDQDVVKQTIPIHGFNPDLAVQASALLSLREINKKLLTQKIKTRPKSKFIKQLIKNKFKEHHLVESKIQQGIMDAETVLSQFGKLIDKSWIVVDESVTNSPAVSKYMNLTTPGQLFKSGGSSLGWALGASIGMKTAEPTKNIMAIVGDGAFIYGCPTASLWGARNHNAPFLTIILNNRQHFASKRAIQALFPRGVANEKQNWPATNIEPSPDYSALAIALDCHGIKITELQEIKSSFIEAKKYLNNGIPVVIDVQILKK
jgi:acetolactate synthase-1/2/3 large subunit